MISLHFEITSCKLPLYGNNNANKAVVCLVEVHIFSCICGSPTLLILHVEPNKYQALVFPT